MTHKCLKNVVNVSKVDFTRELTESAPLIDKKALAQEVFCTSRMFTMIEGYLRKLSSSISESLESKRCSVKFEAVLDQKTVSEEMLAQEKNCVVAEFRICEGHLKIILPFPIINYLAQGILGTSRSDLGRTPGNSELTAVSFLLAKILAEDQFFLNHGVYLKNVSLCNFDELLHTQVSWDTNILMKLIITIEEMSHEVIAIVDGNFCARLATYSKLFIEEKEKALLRKISTKWTVKLQLPVKALSDILNLDQGSKIILSHEIYQNTARASSCLVLQQERADTVNCDQQARKGQQAYFLAKLCEGSLPGCLKITIIC